MSTSQPKTAKGNAMSTYVLMKFLESAPQRYDLGIRIITFGKLEKIPRGIAALFSIDQEVLDIGCGTGTFSLLAARKGARVKAIDPNPQMLEIAQRRAEALNLHKRIRFEEKGIAELDKEPSAFYDRIVASLIFSELSENEQIYALREIHRLLKSNGLFIFIDEIRPGSILKRAIVALIRLPLSLVTLLITGKVTHPVSEIEPKLRELHFRTVRRRTYNFDTLLLLIARPNGR